MWKRITAPVAMAALLGLTACAQTGTLPEDATPRAKLAAKCEVYTGLMETAVANKHLMDPATVQTIDTVRHTYGPKCENIDGVEDKRSTLEALNGALKRLRQIPAIQKGGSE